VDLILHIPVQFPYHKPQDSLSSMKSRNWLNIFSLKKKSLSISLWILCNFLNDYFISFLLILRIRNEGNLPSPSLNRLLVWKNVSFSLASCQLVPNGCSKGDLSARNTSDFQLLRPTLNVMFTLIMHPSSICSFIWKERSKVQSECRRLAFFCELS
jgi:hypothetical protein